MPKALPTPVLYILMSLADHDRHGYGIMQHIREHTAGNIVLGAGELYTSLQRALNLGYIKEVSVAKADADPRGKRCYRLTREGRAAAERELGRLADVMRLAKGSKLRPLPSK